MALVNETHLQPDDKFTTRNYTSYRADRQDRRGGGVAIIIHKSIKHHVVDLPVLNRLEAVAIKVSIRGRTITLISAYNPPGNIDTNDLETILSLPYSLVIAGDLNAKHTDWNCRVSNQSGIKLRELFYNSNNAFEILAPISPTHIPDQLNHEPDILDIALIKNVQHNLTINTLNALDSDHLPVLLNFNHRIEHAEPRTFLNYQNANWEKLEKDIHDSIQPANITTNEELNSTVNNLTATIQKAIRDNIPRKTIKYRNRHIPDSIKRLIRQRNDARRNWQRHHDDQNLRREMNHLRHRIRIALRDHISKTWDSVVANLDTRYMRQTWDITKRIRHQKVVLPPLDIPTGQAETPEDKAEAFAQHLRQTFSPNADDINELFTRETEQLVTNFLRTPPTEIIRRTILPEVAWQIRHLKARKAPGPDGIQNIVLQKLPQSAIQILTNIINAILELKTYPTKWKEGRILLFPKQGKDLKDPDNFRPITLLNTMGKVAEKIINKRLKHNIAQMNILRNEQFGFRTNHNTTAQLLRHTEEVTTGFNYHRATVGLYLDIRQAFDKVWHTGLIRKLINYHINDGMIHLIADYLTNRNFDVQVQEAVSGKKIITSGVPQGSILGPTLFNIYINDIPHDHQNNNSSLYIFADDTLITGQSREPGLAVRQVQHNLELLEDWLKKWRLNINIEKCQAVLYSKRTSHFRTLPPTLRLNGQDINWRQEAKYLGVILDKKMLFRRHIEWNRAKAYGRLKALYPLINYHSHLNIKTAITLYKALIRPIITYACPAWGHAAKTHIKKLEIVQNKILYTITKLPRVTPLRTLHREAGIETISEYIRRSTQQFYDSREGHTNPLVEGLGRYDIQNDIHRRPLRIL